jgi:Tol biopolymer transport system component
MAATWSTPTPISEVNTAASNEQDPWMSIDGKRLLFVSDSSGNNDVYQMSRM